MNDNLASAEAHIATLLSKTPTSVVAERLRRVRKQQKLSIRALAAKAVVSKTSIVNLEKGAECRPITLLKVGAALGLHVDRFFQDTTLTEGEIAVHRKGDEHWYEFGTGFRKPLDLSDSRADGEPHPQDAESLSNQMAMFKSRLEDSPFWTGMIEIHTTSTLGSHPGHEFLYVLSGVLLLQVGSATVRLDVGESAAFHSETEHCYSPGSDVPCQFLCIRVD
jgi:transcriptional regulator with XRE-family HTH domain